MARGGPGRGSGSGRGRGGRGSSAAKAKAAPSAASSGLVEWSQHTREMEEQVHRTIDTHCALWPKGLHSLIVDGKSLYGHVLDAVKGCRGRKGRLGGRLFRTKKHTQTQNSQQVFSFFFFLFSFSSRFWKELRKRFAAKLLGSEQLVVKNKDDVLDPALRKAVDLVYHDNTKMRTLSEVSRWLLMHAKPSQREFVVLARVAADSTVLGRRGGLNLCVAFMRYVVRNNLYTTYGDECKVLVDIFDEIVCQQWQMCRAADITVSDFWTANLHSDFVQIPTFLFWNLYL